MTTDLQQALRKAERRESQLWVLSLGLLILLGGMVVAHYAYLLPDRSESSADLVRSPGYETVAGLYFLIVVFCLHVVYILKQNGRMKRLLVEMNGMAASGMDLDSFLPSIAEQIARTTSVDLCEIALLSESIRISALRSGEVDGAPRWENREGRTFPLERSSVWKRMAATGQPIVLHREEMTDLLPGGAPLRLAGCERTVIDSVLAVPLETDDRILGVVVFGRARRLSSRHFGASTINLTRSLARFAATAIEQARLKREATHDPLTNLYNRRHFSERLKEEISRSKRSGHTLAVLLCDLDRFKAVNDVHGHQVGDELLKAVAVGIKESTRGSDLVFRWGGDEIVVVLTNSSRPGTIIAANRVRDAVCKIGAATRLDVDVSVGIALCPDHGKDEDELIRTADRALYIAKKSGDKVRVGEEDYRLDRRSVKVVFQPIVDLATASVIGYEALSRDPQGKLSTAELFDKYSRIGQLKELKQLTLTLQIEVARDLGLRRVFINVDFEVLGRLDPLPLPPGMDVVLELSEREALHDLDKHLEVASRWRGEGYHLAIDDFGAGFVSFPFIASLVPEYIKVDRSTMLEAFASAKFRVLLTSVLGAMRTYATTGIVAEGIETPEELRLTRDLGISHAQGYLLGEPAELTPDRVREPICAETVLGVLRASPTT